MGLQSTVAGDLRPALTRLSSFGDLARDLVDAECLYRRLAFLSTERAGRRSISLRPLEDVISNLIIELDVLDSDADVMVAAHALQDLLYARLALISAFRQLITPDAEPVNFELVLNLLSVARSKTPSSTGGVLDTVSGQIVVEVNCLRKLIEAQIEIRDLQFLATVALLSNIKIDLGHIRKIPLYRSYASFHWFSTLLTTLVGRANLYFFEVFKGLSSRSMTAPTPLPCLSKKSDSLALFSQIENGVARANALCACLVYNGSDPCIRKPMLYGYQFPDQIELAPGLGSWPCIFSCGSPASIVLSEHMVNIVCLLMGYHDQTHHHQAMLHKEPATNISYVYAPVHPRLFFVVVAATPQSNRALTNLLQIVTTLVHTIKDDPVPTSTPSFLI